MNGTPREPHAAWQVVGDYWVASELGGVRVLAPGGESLWLEGALADAVRARRAADPLLATAARVRPAFAPFRQQLATHSPRPLTRAALMRGTGFETLFLELSARCNERCVHCYAESSPERTETLAWDTVAAVLDDAARLGFQRVQLTGGDPLIAPTLRQAVARARELAFPVVELYTNGIALTESLLDELEPHSPCFAFSVYSVDPAVHDDVTRVPGSHARTLRAISLCIGRGLGVRVGVPLLAHTLHERDRLRVALIALGVAEAHIGFVTSHAVGRGDYVAGINDVGQHSGGGALGGGKACVTASGEIVPCIFARDAVLGSVPAQRLYDVLSSPEEVTASASLERLVDGARERLSCADCRLREAFLSGSSHSLERLVTLRTRP